MASPRHGFLACLPDGACAGHPRPSNSARRGFCYAGILCALLPVAAAAQDADQPQAGSQAQDDEEALVQLNFPAEIEIQALVDYVSERLGVKILYDERIAEKTLTIKAPVDIPAETLLDLLQSALKMKGLTLTEADAPGWKRIVESSQLAQVARPGDAEQLAEEFGAGIPVTQAFVLKHAEPEQVNQIIRPFLTEPGANSVALPDQRVLIVTDFASNVIKLGQVIEMIDQPGSEVVTEFVSLAHSDAADLADQLNTLLSAKATVRGGAAPGRAAAEVQVTHDARTNQLILVGEQDPVAETLQVVQALDVPLELTTEVYRPATVPAERVDRLVEQLVGPERAERLYRSVVESGGNLLIATATEEVHERIRSLLKELDVPAAEARSPVRFHKLKHVTALELLETIRAIETGAMPAPRRRRPAAGRLRVMPDRQVPGPNRPDVGPRRPLQSLPQPPGFRESADEDEEAQKPVDGATEELPSGGLLGDAQLSADPNTNTLIIVGPPRVQRMYADLIDALDQPRPQVLIEAKVVIIDTSDDFRLGVEISGGDRQGSERLFSFSSMGLSDVDPVSGALALRPGLGFNGVLVNPGVADVIVRALASHRRAKVVSAPRLVVSDHATGELSSVAEVPFTSVNASQTVATTSFAGFAQAGMTIVVTPHISEDDQLQLQYQITLNSFTGSGSEGVPPPRQTDEIDSEVTVPDGHTIIVGGLRRRNRSLDVDALPFLEDVPVLRHLVSSQTRQFQESTLFIFLRPVILRGDKFRTLRFLSERDVRRARIPPDYPQSHPVLIR